MLRTVWSVWIRVRDVTSEALVSLFGCIFSRWLFMTFILWYLTRKTVETMTKNTPNKVKNTTLSTIYVWVYFDDDEVPDCSVWKTWMEDESTGMARQFPSLVTASSPTPIGPVTMVCKITYSVPYLYIRRVGSMFLTNNVEPSEVSASAAVGLVWGKETSPVW